MRELKWEKLSKRCLVPVLDGYKYRIKSKTSKVTYWTCNNKSCRAKLHTYDLELYKEIGEHNHPLDDIIVHEKKFFYIIKDRVARNSYETANSVYNHSLRSIVATISDSDLRQYVRTNIKSYESYSTRIYAEKHKYYPAQSNSEAAFSFDRSKAVNADGKSFLFLDMFDELNDVVFAESDYIKRFELNNCRLFMDGTFKTSSNQFYQLFIIHVLRDEISFPLFYCFLHNKSAATDENLFNRIIFKLSEIEINLNPRMVLIDFEEGSYKAIRWVFLRAEVKGCYFYYDQAIWRNCLKFGLKRLYDRNNNFKKLLKLLMALPLVPCSHIESGWNLICDLVAEINENLTDFLNYFNNTWLSNTRPLYDKNIWNHFDNLGPRTNDTLKNSTASFLS